VDHRDGDQREAGLNQQCHPLDPIDLRVAQDDVLPAGVKHGFQRSDDFALRRHLARRPLSLRIDRNS
jgi:hypothetical protein